MGGRKKQPSPGRGQKQTAGFCVPPPVWAAGMGKRALWTSKVGYDIIAYHCILAEDSGSRRKKGKDAA
jgi:hypothetical protein